MGKDNMYKQIWSCAGQLVDEKGYVSAIDLMARMQRITQRQVEDWRFKRIPYLERVVAGNLSKIKPILDESRHDYWSSATKYKFRLWVLITFPICNQPLELLLPTTECAKAQVPQT